MTPTSDQAKIVRLTTVTNPLQAEFLRNLLEDAGITSELGGSGQGGLAGVLPIDVLVWEEDLEKAQKFLADVEMSLDAEAPGEDSSHDDEQVASEE